MEVEKKNNKIMYFVKGFIIFLMMGFGIEIGAVMFDGTPQDEYDTLNTEYQNNVETLNTAKEDLKSIDSEIEGTKLVIENTKKAIEDEK